MVILMGSCVIGRSRHGVRESMGKARQLQYAKVKVTPVKQRELLVAGTPGEDVDEEDMRLFREASRPSTSRPGRPTYGSTRDTLNGSLLQRAAKLDQPYFSCDLVNGIFFVLTCGGCSVAVLIMCVTVFGKGIFIKWLYLL